MKKMIKMVMVLVVGLMMVSCSTGNQRRNVVDPIGDEIWRENKGVGDCDEVFVMVDEDSLLVVVKVSKRGDIEQISKLDVKCVDYEIVEGEDE